ncbi:SIS domain-containing protein [Streptomyces longwoodensis]|uniref:SIS domain-containing protein n=1 Tax=Streptomyces longwoodensis TaxID=68231 RepID=UPI0033E87A7F
MALTPYESDIAEQPAALRRFGSAPLPARLEKISLTDHGRVVITAMGSSHYAGLPTWRRLVAEGHPVWWVSATELLDTPELLTPDTLLIATSQSGRSGEMVALLEGPARTVRTVIGITDSEESPLGQAADVLILLRSGPEATVSSKSYLNTVAAHQSLTGALLGTGVSDTDVEDAARALEGFEVSDELCAAAQSFTRGPEPRLALIGKRDDIATSLMGALVLKEASKIPAEGYIGGEFRHGPMETAGPGLTAVVFAAPEVATQADPSLAALADELIRSGSDVLLVGGEPRAGARHIPLPHGPGLARTAVATRLVQQLSLDIARARGITPGAFRFGQKITTAL